MDRLAAEIEELRVKQRRTIVENVVDLEILAGTRHQTERPSLLRLMGNERKYPAEALEELRRILLAFLASRAPTRKDDAPSVEPGNYFQ